MLGTKFILPIGSVWRCDDGYLIKILGHTSEGWPIVSHANGRGLRWEVNPAWFETWERTS